MQPLEQHRLDDQEVTGDDRASQLSQDHWADLDKAEQSLPALRWIARQLLDAELQGTAVSA